MTECKLLFLVRLALFQCLQISSGMRPHPFRVVKRLFGHVKVRYRGLAKNTTRQRTLFALANLRMARKRLVGVGLRPTWP